MALYTLLGIYIVTVIVATLIMEWQRDEIDRLTMELYRRNYEDWLTKNFKWARKK